MNSSEDSLIKFLKDNKLMELYEKIDTSKDKKKLSFKERFSKKGNIVVNDVMKNNIISVNLIKDKKKSNCLWNRLTIKNNFRIFKKR